MADEQQPSSWILNLTKPKGAFLAVPAIVGAALLVSVVAGGGTSIARGTSDVPTPTADAASVADRHRKARAGAPASARPIQLASEDSTKPSAKIDGSFNEAQRKEIKELVRSYLIQNPQILEEVSQALKHIREKEQETLRRGVLVSQKKSIFRSPHDFVLGNPNGDVTVVEYFDYNCGWCKRALNEVNKLTASDKNVRVVMKEFPIFGEHSQYAAKAALASIKQNKYWQFHTALMKVERVTKQNALEIAKRVGIDVKALQEEMKNPQYDKVIEENSRVAQALGMQGTPGFIVDTTVNYGYVPADGLMQMVNKVRKDGCKVC